MSSSLVIIDSKFKGSRDKGISVGEGSDVLVYNTVLENNAIGIEIKDGSEATVVHSEFINNDLQINAFSKNWRYNAGGNVKVDKSIFYSERSKFSVAKGSVLIVHDSKINPLAIIKGAKRVILNNSNCSIPPCTKNYSDNIDYILSTQGLRLYPFVRGLLP
jgi:hypothetical protein